MIITRGMRLPLSQLTHQSAWEVGITIRGIDTDIALFGLDAAGRLSDDRYMVFYNQPRTPCGGAAIMVPAGDQAGFTLDTSRLPATIHRLVITATVDGPGTMGNIQDGYLRMLEQGRELGRFAFTREDFGAEKAIMLGEFYRKAGTWRLAAVGQGFNGGLEALVKHFGGEVIAPTTPPPSPAVDLSKITLRKKHQSVSLEKKAGAAHGEIKVNLNWNRTGSMYGMDLDLGCLFTLADRQPGAVQALGNHFGSYTHRPWIELMEDDRTGASSDGENLHINGRHWGEIQRVLIYASIYDGAVNWASTDGVVTISLPGQPAVVVELDEHDHQQRLCAVAMLENDAGNIRVTRLVTYHGNEEMVDRAYGFGLRWRPGSKD
ncbi:tellurite resistance protein TerA [Ectothiorhodospira magna]|uniref:Tellurite resistance protein TerA n=1 Tax=Ectothiorhodospira magna TaxID=867345 RepID=A0A1H9EWK0_9GAMM|nr:TerD family protein [Ectothiorhodospira magna]SEQ29358.1 tellurite resistance protein TerA [Ectothiorhodospira magna]